MESYKRMGPRMVDSISIGGLRFMVSHNSKNNLSAFDSKGKLVWSKKIISGKIDPSEEKDVQEIYIRELKEEKGKLVVIDEANKKYVLSPTDGKEL